MRLDSDSVSKPDVVPAFECTAFFISVSSAPYSLSPLLMGHPSSFQGQLRSYSKLRLILGWHLASPVEYLPATHRRQYLLHPMPPSRYLQILRKKQLQSHSSTHCKKLQCDCRETRHVFGVARAACCPLLVSTSLATRPLLKHSNPPKHSPCNVYTHHCHYRLAHIRSRSLSFFIPHAGLFRRR